MIGRHIYARTVRMSADLARDRFVHARVARLATVSADGVPHLVPITFAVAGDRVYFAVDAKPKSTRALRRLSNIAANPAVSVLADRYDEDWTQLWWARADGTAQVVDVAAEPVGVELLAARYRAYVEQPPRGPMVVVAVTRWSGWQAARSSAWSG